jgi:nitrogen fixation-related uncharacterized protein
VKELGFDEGFELRDESAELGEGERAEGVEFIYVEDIVHLRRSYGYVSDYLFLVSSFGLLVSVFFSAFSVFGGCFQWTVFSGQYSEGSMSDWYVFGVRDYLSFY